MSTLTKSRKDHLSPDSLAIIGLLLMAAAFVVDMSTDWTSARVAEVRAVEQSDPEAQAST
jgi:hypothetical protein